MSALNRDLNKLLLLFLAASIFVFLALTAGFLSINYFHKKKLAESFGNATATNLKIRDLRQAIMTLTPAVGENFESIGFHSSEGDEIFRIPPRRIEDQYDEPGLLTTHLQFFTGEEKSEYLMFVFQTMPYFHWWLALWAGTILATVPLFRLSKNMVIKRHEELSQKEHALVIGQIAKQTAHDIRSPLSALRIVVGKSQGIPEDHRSIFEQVVKRIDDISNDLLSLSKNGILDISSVGSFEFFVLQDEIREIFEQKKFEYSDKDIRFVLEMERDPHTINFNRSVLKRIISNLVNNSVESIQNSGRVVVKVFGSHGIASVRVEDNGCGIPADVIQKIGQKNVSYNKNIKNSGYGLGLPYAFRAIQGLGGTVKIESKIDSGTKIDIHIPKSK